MGNCWLQRLAQADWLFQHPDEKFLYFLHSVLGRRTSPRDHLADQRKVKSMFINPTLLPGGYNPNNNTIQYVAQKILKITIYSKHLEKLPIGVKGLKRWKEKKTGGEEGNEDGEEESRLPSLNGHLNNVTSFQMINHLPILSFLSY